MIPKAAQLHAEELLENTPEELRRRPQWVVWRYEQREGKFTKVPYNPSTGRRVDTTDMLSWCAFGEALDAVESGGYSGVGFVFCSADPYVGIDLDECRDPETGEL